MFGLWRRALGALVFAAICALLGPLLGAPGSGLVAAQTLQPVPSLTARVTDRVAALTPEQRSTLEQKLAAYERERGTQIAVLVTDTVQPETIEQYGIRVVEAWKLGRKGVDDGALLLLALKDRELRIEVGYGLEGVLNDAVAKRIIAEVMVPKLKAGEVYGAIDAGVTAMMAVAAGESLPPPARPDPIAGENPLDTLFFVGFILVFFIGGILRSLLGRLPAALLIGLAAAAFAWFLVGVLLVALGAGLLAFVVSLFAGLAGTRSGFPRAGGGFGGGGGFSGGGFGGGGGGFGGGGASGRW